MQKTLNLIKAKQEQKSQILKLLEQSPYENLFIIADINEFGLQSDIVATYVKFKDQQLKSVYYVYYENLLIFDPYSLIEDKELKWLIDQYKIKNIITFSQSNLHTANLIKNNNIEYQLKNENMLILDKLNDALENNQNLAYLADESEIENIIESRKQIKEFSGLGNQSYDLDHQKQIYKSGFYIPFVIKENNQIVSHASTSCLTKNSAMIGGVFTLKEHRNKSYAKMCMLKLIKYLVQNNIKPILFYDNPIAGKVYKDLGFIDYSQIYVYILN
ncbi:GNAT family N-acetyltransferase [Mycoplasmopsis ciconiae]|uniref:GNAT family N-acetyltransferase n=1 Tax=Mycoplasmopsis ciconiae TaxID=561067 RepID=A0ABU7MLD6_9BACT|nr:GNAT family N-acetyltransferase [Mycoplasmopsis ciconiae]